MAGDDRHERLAAALRANLKRRKQPRPDEPMAAADVPEGGSPASGSADHRH